MAGCGPGGGPRSGRHRLRRRLRDEQHRRVPSGDQRQCGAQPCDLRPPDGGQWPGQREGGDSAGDVYSSNFNADSITEYAPGASGNVAPICTIAGSNTGLAENDDISLAPDGTLYVGNFSGNPVEVYRAGRLREHGARSGPSPGPTPPSGSSTDSESTPPALCMPITRIPPASPSSPRAPTATWPRSDHRRIEHGVELPGRRRGLRGRPV